MKLNVFLLGSSLALGPDIQRYLYDNPLCDSIEVCNGNKGKQGSTCKGRLFEGRTKGRIRLGKYDDQFNCRWEVKVPKDKQIKVLYIMASVLTIIGIKGIPHVSDNPRFILFRNS